MFRFTHVLNIFFSFVTCSMHKNPHQNAGNGIKETLFFKIFLGSMAPDPPRGSRAFGVSRANSCPPPAKFLSPYAYARKSRRNNGISRKMKKSFPLKNISCCLLGVTCLMAISIETFVYVVL